MTSEADALRVESELIAAFGTQATGGSLTNQVLPSGTRVRAPTGLVVPSGTLEKAQVGLSLLKSAVMDLVRANPEGVSNAHVANALGLQSDYQGKSINFLSYSLLGLLLREGVLVRQGSGQTARHRIPTSAR